MEGMNTFYEKMLKEKERIDARINELTSALNNFPKGKFFYTRNGKHYKWYCSDGKIMTYIPKKKRQYAEKLATKRYLLHLIDDLKCESKAIDCYIRKRKPTECQADQVYFQDEEYQKLISAYYKPVSKVLQDWSIADYEKSYKYPEQLIHKSISGKVVRSKSEAMIDMFLFQKKIPYHYEELLVLGGIRMYPDFTIRHPKTGEFFYWEHFGMVDDPVYYQKMVAKMRTYITHGICPSVQLIMTYETQACPLSLEMIEKTIGFYFG